jgi:type I restriction-modification system DNA methylase subunit
MDKEEAKLKIAELVDKYKKLSDKEIRALNEANTKQAFILPLFAALGWDIYDTNEVMLEEAASNGRVDFAFKINGVARFYVEAKKLGADLNNPDYIKQAITYAYNKGVTWAILTNFTELRMLNAQGNKPFLTLGHESYLNSFDKLWLLSKEAIQDNLLHKEADEYGVIPHAIPIEEKLFKQLRQWREALYNELFHYNEEWVKPEQRDELIEKLFNRLIFIRTAEDRKLEENKLRSAVHLWENNRHKAGELLDSLREIFAYYNGYYDSELFAPHLLDDNRLYIDEYLIANILNGLYDIPGGIASYDFSVIDADVLGRVYEQYLGYVSKHVAERAKQAQARLDLGFAIDTDYKLVEKKQHRKEQGIYYTPKFVTDYIVKETVGRFLQEHSYNENLNIKILDPACGSGSFLIRAYDELLNYHADVRSKSATEMDSFDRMPILTGNIFGVDLDQQAVEIARLNLLLRGLAKRDHLPPLTDNIKRGNSLISGTDEELKGYFGKNWRDKHPFNWEYEFKDIMANGGFDVVIGNPPYIEFKKLDSALKTNLNDKFESAKGKYDIYVAFLERSIFLLKSGGYLGFICPTMFMKRDYGKAIRGFLAKNCTLRAFIDFSDNQIFGEALNYVGIFIFQKTIDLNNRCITRVLKSNPNLSINEIANIIKSNDSDNTSIETYLSETNNFNDNIWFLKKTDSFDISSVLHRTKHTVLGDICNNIWEGIASGKDEVFYIEKKETINNQIENGLIHPLLRGKDVSRYSALVAINYNVIYPYDLDTKEPISEDVLYNNYPNTYKYLTNNKNKLKGRPYFDSSGKLWYELWCERQPKQFQQIKIVVPEIANKNNFTIDYTGSFFNTKVYGLIKRDSISEDYKYLLGILNSTLLEKYYKSIAPPKAGGFFAYKTNYLIHLPIRRIDFNNPHEKAMHDKLVLLVERMLELNKKLAPIRNTRSDECDELVKEIEKTDKEIDELVYQLYELTPEEIAIVEENSK